MGISKVNISNLIEGTTYYAKSFAKSATLILYGEEKVFSTPISNTEIVTDVNGNTYQTVLIGNQTWMKENLRVTKYRNGDVIPNVLIDRQNSISGAWSYYLDDYYYDSNFGKLYNWYAATDARGICPNGWHMPLTDEWQTLRNFLAEQPGTKLKENNPTYWGAHWRDNPTNSSGFSARGAGLFYSYISSEIKESARFWSNQAYDTQNAFIRVLSYDQSEFPAATVPKGYQVSIRCIKD
jgi:uncharacterized protein (TIGR02145 family)